MNSRLDNSSQRLAIFGGPPVRTEPMPPRKAFGDSEFEALTEAATYYLARDQDPPYQGRYEKQFCDEFSQFMGGGFTDAVASGTGAVFVALAALELPKGSEVIISPVTDSGPLNCIILQGLHPVVADSSPRSYNIGVKEFVDRITPRTSALLAVHAAGEPLEIGPIVEEAHRRGIKVLEDISQAPGALYDGKRVGTFGATTALSTMYRKSLAAGASGGLVFSRSEDLFHKALAYADRGKQTWRTDLNQQNPEHALFPALNWNTDEFSCAIGLASLRRLQDSIDKRLKFLSTFIALLHSRSFSCTAYRFDETFSPFYFPIFVDTSKITCTKNEFAEAVLKEGIPLLPRYGCLVSTWEFADKHLVGPRETPNALATRETSFNLFLTEVYGEQEAIDIVDAICKVESHYAAGSQ